MLLLACDVWGCDSDAAVGPDVLHVGGLPAGWAQVNSWEVEEQEPTVAVVRGFGGMGGARMQTEQVVTQANPARVRMVSRTICPKHALPRWKPEDDRYGGLREEDKCEEDK